MGVSFLGVDVTRPFCLRDNTTQPPSHAHRPSMHVRCGPYHSLAPSALYSTVQECGRQSNDQAFACPAIHASTYAQEWLTVRSA